MIIREAHAGVGALGVGLMILARILLGTPEDPGRELRPRLHV
jgi:hypothetical protein